LSGFNYRFSIIPAGAIIDQRLTPRALQVLCLLGRHTDNNGWCTRSQVKMAKELGCARTTIYDALELLREAQWVERRPNGRGSKAAEECDYPFASYSYRVLLDRDDLPARVRPEPEPDDAISEGAVQAAGGAAQTAGGAAQAAGLEGIPSQGISTEPERERARARRAGLAAFEARWPTSAGDDRGKTAYEWEALSDEERESAIANIGAFLDHLKRFKRTTVPAGWKYLSEKRWLLLEQKPVGGDSSGLRVAIDSDEGRALATMCRIAHVPLTDFGTRQYLLRKPMTPQALAFAKAPPESDWIFIAIEDRNQCGAWNGVLADLLEGRPRSQLVWDRNPGGRRGFMAPWPWPPRKDGTIITEASPSMNPEHDDISIT